MEEKMILQLFLTLSLGAIFASAASVVTEFGEWKLQFGKSYASQAEEQKALATWLSNEAKIQASNSKGLPYTLGHNQFSDLTPDEFYGDYVMPPQPFKIFEESDIVDLSLTLTSVPDAIDWTTKNAVTPVKNQAHCGSCWAFSTTGAIEGALAIKTGKLVSLSEQDLVSCDSCGEGSYCDWGMNGCQGGLPSTAMCWVRYFGVSAEADYPYTSMNGTEAQCKAGGVHDLFKKGNFKPVATVDGFKAVPSNNVPAMKAAVTLGPATVGIEADKDAFQLYKSGILKNTECGKMIDHAVLVVGYGHDTDTGLDYWKVKNSWAATWGEAGYIRMAMGVNQCGVETNAVYPVGVDVYGDSVPERASTKQCPKPAMPPPPMPPSFSCTVEDRRDCTENCTGIFAKSAELGSVISHSSAIYRGEQKIWICGDGQTGVTYDFIPKQSFYPKATCEKNPLSLTCPYNPIFSGVLSSLTFATLSRGSVPCNAPAFPSTLCDVFSEGTFGDTETWLTTNNGTPVKEVITIAGTKDKVVTKLYTNFVVGEPDPSMFAIPAICQNK